MRLVGRWCFADGRPWPVQRRRLSTVARLVPSPHRLPVVATEVGGVTAERVGPAAGPATVVHFHGGGYCVGGPRLARPWAAALSSATGLPVVLPQYRLAPEHPYPAALDDAIAVVRAVASAGPVVVAGDSAGAGLALAATLALRDAEGPTPAGVVLHCPWVDLTADLPPSDPARPRSAPRGADAGLVRRDVVLRPAWLTACAAAYVGAGGDTADPLVSPRWAQLGGLPPLLVQAAGDDLLRSDAAGLVAAARAAGVEVSWTLTPRVWHDFGLQAGTVAAAATAVGQVAAAVARWTAAARVDV
jgi:acetyl esterase/lipase